MQPVYEFLNQLNILLESNLSVIQSLSVLSQLTGTRSKHKFFSSIADGILENIQRGYSFSQSLSLCPRVYLPNTHLTLLVASEYSSSLNQVISFICHQHATLEYSKKQIKHVLMYPIFVVITALLGTLLLIHYKDLYLTSITTDEMSYIVIKALGIFISLLFLLCVFLYYSLKIPHLYQLYYTLGFLQKAGFSFCKSLELCMGNTCHSVMHNTLNIAFNKISRGNSISVSFKETKLADEKLSLLLEVAEKSGTVEAMCNHIADSLFATYEDKKKKCLQLLEPLLLFIVGLYVIILINGIVVPYISDFGGIA